MDESVLSYGHGNSPPFDGVWFAGCFRDGYNAKAACLPVPAGKSYEAFAVSFPAKQRISPLHKSPVSSRALVNLTTTGNR